MDKENNINNILDDLINKGSKIDYLDDLRKSSLKKDGEFGLGNLVFKEFRNRGYLQNLKDKKYEVKSKELSLF